MVTRRAMLGTGTAALLTGRSIRATAQPRSEPVRIGVLEDMSGVFSDLGGPSTVVAARMAVEDFGGKVLDRPIQVIAGDHQNKPDVGVSTARRWFDVEGVGLITGLTNSAVALAVHKLAAEKNRVDIVINAATDALIEESCSPNGLLWNYSARAMVKSTVEQVMKGSSESWFFITSDYAGGRVMEEQAGPLIQAAGGKMLGSVRPPVGTSDFASFLLVAQASGGKILGVVTYGQDFVNMMKQMVEFGLTQAMQPVVPFALHSDLRAVGPVAVQGMTIAAPFYWDLNPATRLWSERFRKLTGRVPDMGHAGAYTAVTHYLKGVRLAETDEAGPVLKAMRSLPVRDMYTENAAIRADGMVVRPIHLFEGKRPSESGDPWDLLRHVGTVAKEVAFALPRNASCKLLKA